MLVDEMRSYPMEDYTSFEGRLACGGVRYNPHMVLFRRIKPLDITFISIWLVTMISTPIVRWIAGEGALAPMVGAGVITQAGVVCVILWQNGRSRALGKVLAILPVAWLVEFFGSTTGFPFGRYTYTNVLQPQVGGVPLLIPVAWMMMFPPAWGIASIIVNDKMPKPPIPKRLGRAGVAALAFTAWDLFLDPQMVSWGFWKWVEPSGFFGIPWVNYIGWFFISIIISFVLFPNQLPTPPLILLYFLTWFLQTIGQIFFWNLTGPALFGFIGMGSMILWAIVKRNK